MLLRKGAKGRAHVAGLTGDERHRFFVYLRNRLRPDRNLLMLAMPLLFLVGWIRDYVVAGEAAVVTLPGRLALSCILLAVAGVLSLRRTRHWQEWGSVVYLLLFGVGIAVTTIKEPSRLSLLHVVIALMLIIWLRFSLRSITAIAVIVTLCLPMICVLTVLHASAELWLAYVLFANVAITIGMASRRTHLEGWLDLFLIRRRLLQRLHEDALTGVANRGAWEAMGAVTHARVTAESRSVCVVFFDVDYFKVINDRYGHGIGDEVLRNVASIMQGHLRKDDLIARIGGEEFVVLIAGMQVYEAVGLAERIRKSVEAMKDPVHVTLSAGVACGMPGESLELLTARADRALLHAKQSGRNRVCVDQRAGMRIGPGTCVVGEV